MSPLQHSVIATVWALVVAGETALLVVLLRRKAWQENAAFTLFIAFCVLRSCLLLYANFVLKNWTIFFLIRWGAYVPQSILLIALVLEVVQIVFRPYDALPRGMLGNFVLSVITITLMTAAFTMKFPGGERSEWITFLQAMDQGVSWSLLGVFAMIAGFATLLGIPWNHRVYGIVAGFIFYLSVDSVVVTLVARIGPRFGNYIWPVDMLAFLVACSGWTYSFAHAEVPRRVPKMEELGRVAAILSQYVFVIESLEVKRSPEATVREKPVQVLLRSEGR
jgi:hypothetical protein